MIRMALAHRPFGFIRSFDLRHLFDAHHFAYFGFRRSDATGPKEINSELMKSENCFSMKTRILLFT
jgi:hypothetical protein